MTRPEPDSDRHPAWGWWYVQSQWAEDGWARLNVSLEREPGLAATAAVGLFVVVGAVGATSMVELPSVVRLVLVVPVLLVAFIATGWSLLPWVASTDRRRAALPIGVLVASTAVCCVGAWWLVPGLAGMVVAAALGVRELRLTGRDVQIEQLRG